MFPQDSVHFTTAVLGELRSRPDQYDSAMEARLIYHLCANCWAALRELPPSEGTPKGYGVSPVILALHRFPTSTEAVLELDVRHRASVLEAGDRNLGFCFLLLEEIRKYSPFRPVDAAMHLRFCEADFSGTGVLLLHVQDAHDLQARYLSLLVLARSNLGQLGQARDALDMARLHLAHGTGRVEVRAGFLEAEAALTCSEEGRDRGLPILEEAAALLADHHPMDHRAEILLSLGNTMLAHTSDNRTQAHGIYEEALAILDGMAPGTNPRLRLNLTHQLVRLLFDIDQEERIAGNPAEVGSARKAAKQHLLDSAALYRRYGTPTHRGERAAFLGLVSLDTDRAAAMTLFREATETFSEAYDADSALELMLRLMFLCAVDSESGGPNPLDGGISHEIWRIPVRRLFYAHVLHSLEELLKTSGPEGSAQEAWQRIEIALRRLREFRRPAGEEYPEETSHVQI